MRGSGTSRMSHTKARGVVESLSHSLFSLSLSLLLHIRKLHTCSIAHQVGWTLSGYFLSSFFRGPLALSSRRKGLAWGPGVRPPPAFAPYWSSFVPPLVRLLSPSPLSSLRSTPTSYPPAFVAHQPKTTPSNSNPRYKGSSWSSAPLGNYPPSRPFHIYLCMCVGVCN